MKNIFKNKKVMVMGLGLNGGGVGVAKFFAKQGASVLVTDLKTKEQLQKSVNELKNFKVDFVLSGHKKEDFISADLIIKNPAVPNNSKFLKIAKEHNIPVKTDIEIFFDLCPAKIIGVTGTKGKSTTATLIYLFLKEKNKNVFLAGNIGVTPLRILSKISAESYIVLELSSFELEDLKKSPQIAVITNLFEDHLNRYGTFKEYVNAKKNIFKYQKTDDYLVLNSENEETRKLAKGAVSQVIYFSKGKEISILQGEHNKENIAAAIAVAKLLGVSNDDIASVLNTFRGIPNRQEFILEKNGVKYFNDTTATNPGSAIEAIRTFKKQFPSSALIFIMGGENKGMNYKNLAEEIIKNQIKLVLLPGSGTEELKKYIDDFTEANSMEDAVKKVFSITKKGDVVVLSPAAASFNLFNNEFDRGNQFVEYVKKI